MEEKRNGKGMVIVIILLIIMILCLAFYICYDKGIIFKEKDVTTSNNDKNTETKKEDEKVTFSDSDLEKYVNYISPVSIGPSSLIYSKDEVKLNNMTPKEKIEYVGSKINSKKVSSNDGQYDLFTIEESDVKKVVEEIYGPNTYEPATFNFGCGDYTLNNGKYTVKTGGCGGSTAIFVSNVVVGYNATKSKLEITTAYAFFDGTTKKIYKDYNITVALDDYTGGSTEETNAYLTNYVKNNKEKLNTIVYTFESADGTNYYFTGFKNNK